MLCRVGRDGFSGCLIKAFDVFQLAARRERAHAGDSLERAAELVHQFDGLVGLPQPDFVAEVEVLRELFAEGEHLLGGVKFAGVDVAGLLGG